MAGEHHESATHKQKATVVFTTESQSMVEEKIEWAASEKHEKALFDFDFVTNSRDLLPGSGFIKTVGTYYIYVWFPLEGLSCLPSLNGGPCKLTFSSCG